MLADVEEPTAPRWSARVWDPIADVLRFERLHTRMFGTRPDKPHVGRYELGERLGRGGAGFVHRGFDPVLRRSVAIKLVPIPADLSAARADELMAEAHALAAIDHPNLVQVHDAGTCRLLDLELSMYVPTSVAGQRLLYMVMELVEGPSLERWLETSRSRREILTAFASMGDALAAAHAAGIVHRDFKPSNVAFDGQEQPKILDFGLAGPGVAGADDPSHDLIVGTPAYMAPEQHDAQPGGPEVDQFAYCVTLWEALTGSRPYPGPALAQYRRQKLSRQFDTSSGALPSRLRAILRRGLDPDPRQRWDQLSGLVAAIRRTQRRAGVLAIVTGAVVVAAAATATTLAVATRPATSPCEDDPHGIAEPIWSSSIRDRVAKALGDRIPYPTQDLLDVVERRFGGFEQSWTSSYQQACATDSPSRDETVRCLLAAKAASRGVLQAVERQPDTRAVHALDLLPEPTECLREDLTQWQWKAALGRELMEYRSRLMLGEIEAVLSHADHLLESAETLPPAMVAEWSLVSAIGRMSTDPNRARSSFEHALTLGERAGNDRVAVRALLGLSSVLARTNPRQARLYLELADSRRTSLGPRVAIALDAAWAMHHLRVEHDHEAALGRARAVVEQLSEIDAPPAVAINSVVHLAMVLTRMGRLDEADTELRDVLVRVGPVDAIAPAQRLLAARGFVSWLRGDVGAAARDLDLQPPGPAFLDVPNVLEIYVRASVDRGFPDDAQRLIDAFADRSPSAGDRDPTLIARAGLELYRGRYSAASTFPSPQDVPGRDWELELLAASEAAIAGRTEDVAAAMATVAEKARDHDPHGLRLLSIDAAEVAVMTRELDLCMQLLEPVRSGPVPHLRARGHLVAARAMIAAGRHDLADRALAGATRELEAYEQPWVLGEIELQLLEAAHLALVGNAPAARRRATAAMNRRGGRQSLALARAASLLVATPEPELSLLAELWVRQLGHEVGADDAMVEWLATGRGAVPAVSVPDSNPRRKTDRLVRIVE
ncbi:MAG: serine/threonine protein kinase [Deltaproteobacteria bacterium]|nr:serine/threonine protein kinase [Deltaproteobacteria bacterium]